MSAFDAAYNDCFGNQAAPEAEPITPPTTSQTTEGQQTVDSGPTVTPSPGTAPAGDSQGRREFDTYGDHNFVVTIDGLEAGAFQKCDGLSFEVDLIEYRDSMDPYPRYRPGIRRFGRIKLTKGYVGNSVLWDWCQAIMEGENERRNGSIQLYEDDGQTLAVTYRFTDAFPVKWNGFRFDGKGNSSLVEEIELVTESVSRESS